MKWNIDIRPYRLVFKQPAGTSRGIYRVRDVFYLYLSSPEFPGRVGIGECAPLPNLSCDDLPDYSKILYDLCQDICAVGAIDYEKCRPYPSMLFGLETAFRHWKQESYRLWNTPFSHSDTGIPINGLIWMGSYDKMLRQIEEKLKLGFRCVKLKIGAIDFEEELNLLAFIRRHFNSNQVELRVDANGAFESDEALGKLTRLAALDLHSIEQPIRAGQWHRMSALVRQSPLPIALDEELIDVNTRQAKCDLLDTIRPPYIILKPSLHGGLRGCQEWIEEAEVRGIQWWITSALESNIGLNAIAQWCATFHNPLPQGLGTGSLYINNISLPLQVIGDQLFFKP